MTDRVAELYDPYLQKARARLDNDPGLRALLDPHVDPAILELYLIYFSSRGVKMTEPVERWIRRAGERCIELNLDLDLGRSLQMHARHEAGHQTMMIDDTRFLVDRWNAKRTPKLDADELLARPVTPTVQAYIELHEDTVNGMKPFAQTAIEYEIERMSTVFGPIILKHCKQVLGQDVITGLSFMEEHTAIDVGHTELNRKMLNRLLAARPEEAQTLGEIGALALETYNDFFVECIASAREENAARTVAQAS
jgi:hypothetical protein